MFIKEECKYKNLSYIFAHPENYDPAKKYPAVLLLHGSGSRGTDMSLIKNNPFFRHADLKPLDAVVYAPQCFAESWFEIFEQLINFAGFAAAQPYVDSNRLYLTGVSMGGYAAWQLAMSHPELFAAVVPICGGGMYWCASALKNVPVWAFHGALDTTVYVTESINMVNAVNRNGGSARLTVYPDAAHNSWDSAFSDDCLWNWLMSQHKSNITGQK